MRRLAVVAIASLLVAGCSSGGAAGVGDVKSDTALMLTFATDLTTACSTGGSQACASTRLAHAYPGSMDVPSSQKCIAAQENDPKDKYSIVIAEDTI